MNGNLRFWRRLLLALVAPALGCAPGNAQLLGQTWLASPGPSSQRQPHAVVHPDLETRGAVPPQGLAQMLVLTASLRHTDSLLRRDLVASVSGPEEVMARVRSVTYLLEGAVTSRTDGAENDPLNVDLDVAVIREPRAGFQMVRPIDRVHRQVFAWVDIVPDQQGSPGFVVALEAPVDAREPRLVRPPPSLDFEVVYLEEENLAGQEGYMIHPAGPAEVMDRIRLVEYHLHPSYPRRIRTRSRAQDLTLEESAWMPEMLDRHPAGWKNFVTEVKVLWDDGSVSLLEGGAPNKAGRGGIWLD